MPQTQTTQQTADNQQTEEQVKIANEMEQAKWQGDYKEEDLRVPYKRDKAQETTAEEEAEETKDDESEVVEETVDYSEPAPVVTVEDPGEYKPADYSFEVTLKDGKSVKVSSPEEADRIGEDPDNFTTPKQLSDFINESVAMRTKLDRDYEKWQADKKKFDEQTETANQRQETLDGWSSEFDYLVSKGLLPEIAKEYKEADWSDPEVSKQPGVKEQIAIIRYMEKENSIRLKNRVKPLSSIVDAYNSWKIEEDKRNESDENRRAGEARKTAGAKIAGVSPAHTGAFVPKGIAVGNPNVFKRDQAQWED